MHGPIAALFVCNMHACAHAGLRAQRAAPDEGCNNAHRSASGALSAGAGIAHDRTSHCARVFVLSGARWCVIGPIAHVCHNLQLDRERGNYDLKEAKLVKVIHIARCALASHLAPLPPLHAWPASPLAAALCHMT